MIIYESKSTKKLQESGGSDENFVGKTATDLVSKLKAKGYHIDSSDLIYIKNNPKGINGDSIILIKGSKKYRATFNYYFNGDYEVLVYYDKLAESKYIKEALGENEKRIVLQTILNYGKRMFSDGKVISVNKKGNFCDIIFSVDASLVDSKLYQKDLGRNDAADILTRFAKKYKLKVKTIKWQGGVLLVTSTPTERSDTVLGNTVVDISFNPNKKRVYGTISVDLRDLEENHVSVK